MECIIVHGGAWNIPKQLHESHIKGCMKAAEIGFEYLDDAIEAVVEAVAYMEDDETFDAGRGSFLNENGDVEMDAMVYGMDNFGSVLGVKHVKNPVRLAYEVYKSRDFSILVADGAEKFAEEKGMELVSNDYFKVTREIERWKKLKKAGFKPIEAFSTVGAVALDRHGKIAVALSTGGTPLKKSGRVGDTPIPAAGGFVAANCGTAATGYGEAILRYLLAKRVCDEMASSSPRIAARKCIDGLKKMGGYGGVICLNNRGEYGYAYNTKYMAVAFKSKEGKFSRI